MRYIDVDNWKRKDHFEFFHKMECPQYNVCSNIDVTNFLRFVKEKKYPFYYAMMFEATKAANKVENLRYRIRNEKVILHDKIHPSFTAMNENEDDLFKYVTVDMADDMETFVRLAKEKADSQKEYFAPNGFLGRDDLLYITCIPWISFTSITNARSFDCNDATPRASWGKYFKDGDKMMLPFSLEVSHLFVDGIHVARFLNELQEDIDNLK